MLEEYFCGIFLYTPWILGEILGLCCYNNLQPESAVCMHSLRACRSSLVRIRFALQLQRILCSAAQTTVQISWPDTRWVDKFPLLVVRYILVKETLTMQSKLRVSLGRMAFVYPISTASSSPQLKTTPVPNPTAPPNPQPAIHASICCPRIGQFIEMGSLLKVKRRLSGSVKIANIS